MALGNINFQNIHLSNKYPVFILRADILIYNSMALVHVTFQYSHTGTRGFEYKHYSKDRYPVIWHWLWHFSNIIIQADILIHLIVWHCQTNITFQYLDIVSHLGNKLSRVQTFYGQIYWYSIVWHCYKLLSNIDT
jgi:hypothetical protein